MSDIITSIFRWFITDVILRNVTVALIVNQQRYICAIK